VLALALALIQSVVPMLGARWRDDTLMGVAGTTALAQFAFVAIAFAALTASYVASDFSVPMCSRIALGDAAHLQVHQRAEQRQMRTQSSIEPSWFPRCW